MPTFETYGEAILFCNKYGFRVPGNISAFDLATAFLRAYTDGAKHATTEKVLMPKELTAENGAKALLIGEFKETIKLECPECEGTGDGEEPDDGKCIICDGHRTYGQAVDVSWTTIKTIYAMAVEHLSG